MNATKDLYCQSFFQPICYFFLFLPRDLGKKNKVSFAFRGQLLRKRNKIEIGKGKAPSKNGWARLSRKLREKRESTGRGESTIGTGRTVVSSDSEGGAGVLFFSTFDLPVPFALFL